MSITTPVFIIGLGGVGNSIVRLVKERFRVLNKGEVPETVILRSIDTAEQITDSSAPKLTSKEFTKIGEFPASEILDNLNVFPEIKRWWKYEPGTYAGGFVTAGAGAKRPVGRLSLFHEFATVHEALNTDFQRPLAVDLQQRMARAGLEQVSRKPVVLIVGSLAGGTCSGMFVDIAFMAREMLKRAGYESGAIRVRGVFAMPSVVHLASEDAETDRGETRRVNTAGALREIDYLQRGWQHTDFSILYPNPLGQFEPTSPFLDQVYLFSCTKKSGHVFTSQQDVLLRASHFVFGQAALDMKERMQQILINEDSYFDPSQRTFSGGMLCTYASFGIEWLEVPGARQLQVWSNRLAGAVTERIADFDFNREEHHNLVRTIREEMPTEMRHYAAALDLMALSGGELAGRPELRALEDLLEQAAAATKKQELKIQVDAFLRELPGITSRLCSTLSPSADETREKKWAKELASRLIADREYRVGGARRVMNTAADKLSEIAKRPGGAASSVDRIMDQVSSTMLGKVDGSQVVPLLQREAERSVQHAVVDALGAQAEALAGECRRLAKELELAKEAVVRSAELLKDVRDLGPETPPDTWMLDIRDIEAALEADESDIVGEISDVVAAKLSESFAAGWGGDLGMTRDELEIELARLILEAIQRAAGKRTKRPQDAVERIKQRMAVCQPMMQLTGGVERRKVMPPQKEATPIKIVLTSIKDQAQRNDLQEWANEERRNTAEFENAFQIGDLEDEVRDEVFYLDYGWPLWLMPEPRRCWQDQSEQRRHGTTLSRFNLVLTEIPEIWDHTIEPTSEEDTAKLFGVALALGAVRHEMPTMGTEHLLRFDSQVFGRTEEVRAELTELYGAALEAFQNRALVSPVEKKVAQGIREDPDEFKSKVLSGVSQKLERAESARSSLGDSFDVMERCLSLAKKYAEGIVVL